MKKLLHYAGKLSLKILWSQLPYFKLYLADSPPGAAPNFFNVRHLLLDQFLLSVMLPVFLGSRCVLLWK